MLIKSRVKYIQSLGQKKFRDNEGVFVAEGPKIINEFLNAPNVQLISLMAVSEWIEDNQKLLDKYEDSDLMEIKQGELEKISFLSTPNQVLGLFKKPSFPVLDLKNAVSLALDAIQDPGNLGTIVRIADWFGLKNLICSMDCADLFSPKGVQSTMGSICRVQLVYTDIREILLEYTDLPVYGTMLKGKSIHEIGQIKKGLILIGNDSRGVRDDTASLVQIPVTIPGKGSAESLNVAVATGIVLSHLLSFT